jgi:hypothetical protein
MFNELGGNAYCFLASLSLRCSLDRSRKSAGEVPRYAIRSLGVAQLCELGKKRLLRDLT